MSDHKDMMDEMLCKQGDMIFKEGDTGSCMFKLLVGSAEVFANYGEEEEKLLTVLHAGDYFGEMAVIEISPRSATVLAAENGTRLKVIDAHNLGDYLKENAGEINAVARHMSGRLRELTKDYTEVCDMLRELGRLDTSGDKINEGLFERVKKFAAVYFKRGRGADAPADTPITVQKDHNLGYSLPLESYQRGGVIFGEHDVSDCMYDIHAGRVGIYTGYGTAQQKLLAELTPNMFFGEMGMFERLHRSASAVALEDDTRVEPIHESDLSELFAKNSAKALMLLQHLSNRLRRLTKDYLSACKALAEAEIQIEASNRKMTPETREKLEYMNQLLLTPEIMY